MPLASQIIFISCLITRRKGCQQRWLQGLYWSPLLSFCNVSVAVCSYPLLTKDWSVLTASSVATFYSRQSTTKRSHLLCLVLPYIFFFIISASGFCSQCEFRFPEQSVSCNLCWQFLSTLEFPKSVWYLNNGLINSRTSLRSVKQKWEWLKQKKIMFQKAGD